MHRFCFAWLALVGVACGGHHADGPVAANGWHWKNPSPQGNAINFIWVQPDNPHSVYAAGDAGTILHSADGGATWATQPTPTAEDLTGIAGDRGAGVFVVGKHGTVLVSVDGTTWTAQPPRTDANLNAIHATGHGELFAVGDTGTILRSTDGGAAWTPLISGTKANLMGITGDRADRYIAVGAGGVILSASDDAPTWKLCNSTSHQDL